MRLLGLCFLLFACATSSTEAPGEPATLRERLEREDVTLAVARAESDGAITALYKTSGGWSGGESPLAITDGELVVRANAAGTVRVDQLAIALAPIDLPEPLLGYPAQLTDIAIGIARPAAVSTTWIEGDSASGTLALDLELTWTFTAHGDTSPLGSPDLPPVPAELVLGGDGAFASAELRIRASGELWSWANLLRLEDLRVTLVATTPSS